ncbi:hypothetical protein KFV11_05730 [Macrococcus equipercicus]|uniref:Permease n=1 Tax=Macrococcus equipercicus TaxID=69967 RepID=A0A9Q9BUR5_9STAP|nr:hypothetical protein ERX35_004560 [Macrococcus equipercicus]UTH14874.1 hypothetical protein KFV11_05730 [Macrococcus equipercicus]
MSYTDIPNFLLITIIGMLLLSLVFGLFMNKFILAPVFTFIVLAICAFILPNFFDIKYPALLGYAVFLTVISLILSAIFWYVTKDSRDRKRRERRAAEERQAFEDKQNRARYNDTDVR